MESLRLRGGSFPIPGSFNIKETRYLLGGRIVTFSHVTITYLSELQFKSRDSCATWSMPRVKTGSSLYSSASRKLVGAAALLNGRVYAPSTRMDGSKDCSVPYQS